MKKTASGMLLIPLLLVVLTLAFYIQPVRASGTIYIRLDGSVEGTDKIERDGDVYTFTDNIYVPPSFRDAVVVERSNIIIDGDGHTLQGGSGGSAYLTRGFDLTARSIYPQPLSNVTIQNTNISNFDTGVSIYGGGAGWFDSHIISRNNITNNDCGIALSFNSYTNISENSITNNDKCGICSDFMGWYNIISGNNITNNGGEGISFADWPGYGCGEETCYLYNISGNNIMANGGAGISFVYGCGSNDVCGNNITNNDGGIYIYDAWDNTISGNNITANGEYGISIRAYDWDTPSNVIFGNIIAGHNYGVYMEGNLYDERWIRDAGDNTISGNNITDNGDGVFLGSYCTNNIVSGNSITYNKRHGIDVSASTHNDIYGNNITNNEHRGIDVYLSEHNNICENNITNNGWSGIYLNDVWYNIISGNNITNNDCGISGDIAVNYNIISGNNITNNNNEGLSFEDGFSNNNISGNNVMANGGAGISFVYECGSNDVCGNNVINNNGGIYIYKACSSNTISGNNITANGEYGISLTTHEYDTVFNFVFGNIIAGHNYGVYLQSNLYQIGGRTRDNTIYGNNVTDNYSGIELYDASDNTFFHNNLIGNTQQVHDVSWENAMVPPSVNTWDEGYPSGGNYWSDYSSGYPGAQEVDDSGIWDTPYVIDSNNQDNYPLMDLWTPVVVDVEASDPDGSFTVVINAGADKGTSVTSWTVVITTNILSYNVDLSLDGMTITITGQLDNPNLEGQIVLEVDPEGQIITYDVKIASYARAYVESCDSDGVKKDTFDIPDEVYVTGNGYSTFTTYDIYVVEDVVTWTDGMSIPSRVPGTATSVSSDAIGSIPPTLVWSPPLVPGRYDIVVDVNGNGVYDEDVDTLDDSDIKVTAGFFIIPEVPLGTIMAAAAMIIALVAYVAVPKFRKKQITVNP